MDDLRGRGPARRRVPLRIGGGRSGLVTIIVLVVAYLIGGPELLSLFVGGGGSAPAPPRGDNVGMTGDDEAGRFVAAILGSTEDTWEELFRSAGETYAPPRLTLFSGAVDSACGYATSAVGPFYCPPEQRVFLDTDFFAELARMGGAGDFAQAYVIGHEVGHHVQTLLGTSARVRDAQSRAGQRDGNRLQVAMELQADCFAGIWAHHANRRNAVLEPGDVDEGMAAAAAIGDDRLQRSAGRTVTPDSFTHGSSAQRQQWLRTGLRSGNPNACDTFADP